MVMPRHRKRVDARFQSHVIDFAASDIDRVRIGTVEPSSVAYFIDGGDHFGDISL
jgi:hypothetical protein